MPLHNQDALPFAHLSAPNSSLYRDILRAFARAKECLIVHLRPEDVAAELRRDSDEQVVAALGKLVEWGNLRADADTSRVTSVEDFHRRRFLFQLTSAGHAAEQAIAFYEEAIGRRGSLQSVALGDIAEQLQSPQLRRTDSYERRGKPNKVADRSQGRRLLREHAEREAAETAAARARLHTEGPILLSDLGTLDPLAFRLFLALMGDALAARHPGETEVKTVTGDGSMEVRLTVVPDGGLVRIHTENGVLTGPERLIEITDLMAAS